MKTIFTEKAPAAVGPYSQAKVVRGLLFASGQIPLDPKTGSIVAGGIVEQTEQVCKNIDAVLAEAGCDFSEVIKTTCFLADIADFKAFNEVYAKYFTSKPARSCVAVKDLPIGCFGRSGNYCGSIRWIIFPYYNQRCVLPSGALSQLHWLMRLRRQSLF